MKRCKLILTLTTLAAVVLLSSSALFKQCAAGEVEQEVSGEQSDEIAASIDNNLVGANTRFGFNIFKELILEDEDQNVFISPLSILMALAMTYNGAVGDTNLAMAEALQFTGFDLEELNSGFSDLMTGIKNADSDIEMAIANSIWYRLGYYSVKEDFIERNEKYYSSEVRGIDFSAPEAVGTINGWIKDATRGKIKKMLDSIPEDAVMYLINAIYFKGNWTYPFDENVTADEDFFLIDGSTKKVPMMSQQEEFLYCRGDNFSGIRLPYGQEKMAMYIILPDEGESVDSVINSMDEDTWNQAVESFFKKQVRISMPKYKMEYGIKLLNDVLTNLGMGIAFDMHLADLSGIFLREPGESPFISRVLHKAVIEVNEEGSEAAAATVVEIMESAAAPEEIIQFIVNRPFFFVIEDDRTGSILFMGKVIEP